MHLFLAFVVEVLQECEVCEDVTNRLAGDVIHRQKRFASEGVKGGIPAPLVGEVIPFAIHVKEDRKVFGCSLLVVEKKSRAPDTWSAGISKKTSAASRDVYASISYASPQDLVTGRKSSAMSLCAFVQKS